MTSNNWKQTIGLAFLVCSAAASTTALKAQDDGTTSPPKVLYIVREMVKPGKGAAHEKSEAAFVSALAAAKAPTHYLAAESLSGPDRALFMNGFSSFADMEEQHKAMGKIPGLNATLDRLNTIDGELLTETGESAWTRRDEMSLNSSYPPKTHLLEISVYEIKPGHEKEWDETVKLVKAGYQKGVPSSVWTIYEEAYGPYMNGFLVIVPIGSMSDVDKFFTQDKDFVAAMGTDGMKKLAELEASCVQSVQTNLFVVAPKMSAPPDAWVKAEPDFWKPKAPAPVKKADAKPAQ